jgi:hypothetical protein
MIAFRISSGLFHDGRQTNTVVASAADGASSDIQDSVVSEFLATGG